MCFHVQWIVHAQFKQYMFAFFGILSIVLSTSVSDIVWNILEEDKFIELMVRGEGGDEVAL